MRLPRRLLWIAVALFLIGIAAVWLSCFHSKVAEVKPSSVSTVASRLAEYGAAARARLKPKFEKAGVEYPPPEMKWLALKDEKRLEIHAPDRTGRTRLVSTYPILAASGGPGPKLREGDRQVPEGFYRVEALNPNSLFHLSLRVNYPNPLDREHAAREGRATPGTDIMIHGSDVSAGCLAMGDTAAEDFFVLAADSGIDSIEILLAPHDLRSRPEVDFEAPEWMTAVYARLRNAMRGLPAR